MDPRCVFLASVEASLFRPLNFGRQMLPRRWGCLLEMSDCLYQFLIPTTLNPYILVGELSRLWASSLLSHMDKT